MAQITLKGVDPYDGVYSLKISEDEPFTTGELNIIKQVSGVRGMEIEDAFAAGDTDLIVALAVVALYRAGKVSRKQALFVAEKLWAAPGGGLLFDADEDEKDAPSPPAQPPTGDDSK